MTLRKYLQPMVQLPILVVFPKVCAPFLAVYGLAGLVRGKRLADRRLLPAAAVLAGLLMLAALSSVWSVTPIDSLLKTGQMALVALAGLMLAADWHFVDDEQRHRMARLAVYGWIAAVALGLVMVGLKTVGVKADVRVAGLRIPVHLSKNGAVTLVMASFPGAFAAWRLPRGRLLAVVAIILTAILARKADSASGFAGLVAGWSVAAAYARFPRLVRMALMVALPVLTLAMPVLVQLADPQAVVGAIPNFPTSFAHRLIIWDFVGQRIHEHPILGWGFDAARAIPGGKEWLDIWFPVPWREAPYHVWGEILPLHPHNAYLQIWLELGAVGAVALAAVLTVLIGRSLADGRDSPPWALAGLIAAAMMVGSSAYGMWQAWWLAVLVFAWVTIRLISGRPAASPAE
ncbi:MAG: O-antigen ligase family protein [Solirubrobacterales bacterium]